jgi:hypothetical protein
LPGKRGGQAAGLAFKGPGREYLQHLASLDPAGRQPKDYEVGPPCIEHRAQLRNVPALARDKAKFFQSFHEESSNMISAIGHADARPNLSPAKRSNVDPFFSAQIIHERLPLH